MDFKELQQIQDEITQIQKTYEIFNEDSRLNHSKAARVEFLTTVRCIGQYLRPGDRILDIGAGAGEYSLHFARRGYAVSAVELSPRNVTDFRKKIGPDDQIELIQGNATDLSMFPDGSFDIVLLFGPLYHLHAEADRQKCIAEALRVCRDGGKIFFAFIGNDMVFMTELGYDGDYFASGDYDKDSFALNDFPFVFHTVPECREMLQRGGVRILREVASDGFSELMAQRINAMDEESYRQYLRWHFYISEKPEMLGASNHLLFVGEKY